MIQDGQIVKVKQNYPPNNKNLRNILWKKKN